MISDAVSRNKFDEIKMVLHFNNNAIQTREDPLYIKRHKVQPSIDHFRCVFKNLVLPETFMSVDDQVLSFMGIQSMKCYLPKKSKIGDIRSGSWQEYLATSTILKFVVD